MMAFFFSIVAGLVFGIGLVVSGMTKPEKVLGFLNLSDFKTWDGSLLFVMGGGILVYSLGFFLHVRKRRRSLTGEPLALPTSQIIDGKLIFGSAIFGVGWGLLGVCPGPNIVQLGAGAPSAALFTLAMVTGMIIQHRTSSFRFKKNDMPSPESGVQEPNQKNRMLGDEKEKKGSIRISRRYKNLAKNKNKSSPKTKGSLKSP